MPIDTELLGLFDKFGAEADTQFTGKINTKLLNSFDDTFPAPRPLTGAQQEELEIAAQEEAQMQQARGKLESSPLPGMYAFGVQAGAPWVSGIARLLGKGAYADTMNRTAARIEQAQREREKGGPVPDILQSGLRGAGASAVTMFGAGMVGGPNAAIAAAAAQQANRSITAGKDAGKTGADLAGYAITQGVIEGAPAWFMQKIGLGGMESLVGKRAVVTGIKDALKRFGVQFAAEHAEEQVTEHLSNAWAAFRDVDPEAMSPESIRQTAYETAVQTTLAMGLGHAVVAGKPRNIAEIHREIEAYAEEGKTPSRRVYKRWNLGPGLPGDSVPQRRAFIEEMGKQLKAGEGISPQQIRAEDVEFETGLTEAPEAALAPAEPEGVLTPEIVQEGLAEPMGAPDLALDPQDEAGLTLEPGMEADLGIEAPVNPLAPQGGDDSTVALNRAQGNKIMEDLGAPPLDPAIKRPWPIVAAEVAVGKLDERALDDAIQIMKTRRAGTDTEHVAMQVKAGKLMDQRDQINADMSAAVERNDSKEYDRLSRMLKGTIIEGLGGKTMGILGQIELLARADAYAVTPAAQSVSIRRMKLSRENYDVVSVIQDYRIAKGPDAAAMTEEELDKAGEHSDAILTAQAEVDQVAGIVDAEEAAKSKAAAQEILNSVKPKRGAGKSIKERAAIEIDEIKARIKALGEVGRVNDILGVSAEGSYLIGRLGIAYIKSGVGTLVEVAENLRSSFPDLNITDRDVWNALIASNPKLKSRLRTEAEKRVSLLQSLSKRFIKLDNMAQGLAMEGATRSEVSQELKRLQVMDAELSKRIRIEQELESAKQGEFKEGEKRPPDSPVIAAMKKELGELRSLRKIIEKVALAKKGVFDPTRRKREVSKEINDLRREYTRLRREFYEADFDKVKLDRAVDTVNRLQDMLDDGKKRIKAEPKKIPPELAEQKEIARQLRRELDVDAELENINRQIETGIYEQPIVKEKKPIDPRLQRKQVELQRRKNELSEWKAAAEPWGAKRVTREVASLMKSMKATADVSFTLRQNVWHPFKTLGVGQKAGYIGKAIKGELTVDDKFFPSLHALFNEYTADEIRNSMVNGENGFLYEKHGLAILDSHSVGDKNRSEIFQNNVIERSNLPGLRIWGAVMRASSRHAVTIGNLVRTSVFDQFLANNPNATDAELTAWADYCNVSTGIGNLGRFGAVGDELQMVFFSPKFAASRPQIFWGLYKHRKLPRVQKAIAKDMARNVGTGLLVLALADLAGFDVEWTDSDDPDWGSIRYGNTRWDIFGGIKQFARVIARTAKYPFRDDNSSDLSPIEMASRSISYKLSPIVTTSFELLTGETIIGKDVDPPDWIADVTGEEIGKRVKTLAKVPIPIVDEDIYEAVADEGLFVGLGAAVTTLPGIGTQTYQDSRTAAFQKIRMYYGREEYGKAAEYKAHWNEHNNALPPSKRKKPIGVVKRLPKK